MHAQGRQLDARRLYRSLGNKFLSGRLEGSIPVREAALREADEPYRSLGLGEVAYRKGEWKQAERFYRSVVETDPGEPWGWIGLGRTLLTRGNHGPAFTAFTAAIWCAPRHPSAWYGRSLAAQRLGWRSIATSAAQVAVGLAPLDQAAMNRLAIAARREGRKSALTEAAEVLTQVGEGGSADALLAAARLWVDADGDARAQAALALAVKAGALQAELEACTRAKPTGALGEFARSFTAGTQARYRHFRVTGQAESLDQFVDWARAQYEAATGEKLEPRGSFQSYPFVGKLVDATAESDEPLVRRLAEQGILLVLGQRSGGPPEAILARIIRRTHRETVRVRGQSVEREAIWIEKPELSGYVEWAGGGDLAGLALGAVVLVDLHAAAQWEGALRRRRERQRPYADEALSQQALEDDPITAVDDPAGVADRLLFGTDIDLAAEILVHEDAHLADAARFLPVGGNLLRGFGLALSHGFQAEKVVAHLERNAQLTAIAEGPHPRAAFSVCCAAIGGSGPHSLGYTQIVRAFVNRIHADPTAYPAIDRSRVIVQQVHRLSAAEIRALAVATMQEWGLAVVPAEPASATTSR